MDFTTLAKNRYSVRKFSDKPLSQSDLGMILETGRLAPTACNNQPQKIIVINSAEGLEKFQRCTRSSFGATCALLVCYDKNLSWKRDYDGKDSGDIDASIVTTHMMLKASEIGVGSTWVMHFIPEAVIKEFSLPDNIIPVVLLVMGYPAEDASPSPRHSLYKAANETIFYNELTEFGDNK